MLHDLFANFSILIALAYLTSLVIARTERHAQSRTRTLLVVAMGVTSGLILMQYGIPVQTGVIVDFRHAVTVTAGLAGGVKWGVTMALPLSLFRYFLGGIGAIPGSIAILAAGLLSGLMRTGLRSFLKPFPNLVWRSALIFAIVDASLGLVPNGPMLLRKYWLIMLIGHTLSVLVCTLVLQSFFKAQVNLLEAEHLAHTDHLTGLPNLRSFEEAFATRDGQDWCLLSLDIDHFKIVNDTHGHPIGDEVLKGVASVIQTALGPDDLAYRVGGEEFAVLISGPIEHGARTAERIRQAVEMKGFATRLPNLIRVTVSGGVVPIGRRVLSESVAAADGLLYEAKQTGRNRVTAFH